jgi:hypothetical protein
MTIKSEPPHEPAISAGPVELPPDDRSLAWPWLIGFAAVFNFFFCPVIVGAERSEVVWLIAAIGVGVLAGEFGLATWWLVWGPGSFARRLLIHWGVASGLFVPWALGLGLVMAAHRDAQMIPKTVVASLCSLPILSLAAQIPLWPLRTYLGWRIERQLVRGDASDTSQSLTIRDILWATVATSVSLASLRLNFLLTETYEPQFWASWGLAVAVVAVISALSLLPAAVIAFRIQETFAAAAALAGYALLAWIATCVIVAAVSQGSAPPEGYIAILFCVGSFAATLALPLLILASRGYRLTFAGERQRRDV